MNPTDIDDSDYSHKVVNCQWACPAHTPVPEYIRLVAAGRYADAYMLNWQANVFPGILGRICDRPCEPACRRGRVSDEQGKEPVAVCRLERVAADFKDDIRSRLPKIAAKNGKRIACIGAGPASLTVARDLAPLGYRVTVFESEKKAGGSMRSRIPRLRLPEKVIDEETGYILDMGVEFRSGKRIESLKELLGQGYDAIFVGCGAPRGRDLDVPGRVEAAVNIHLGIDWLASVSFGHTDSIGKRVIVLGGGNTAIDCGRSARRLGGEDVKLIVRSGFEEMKASPQEKEDAQREGIQILNRMLPKSFTHDNGRLTGMVFEHVKVVCDAKGKRSFLPTGAPDQHVECDDVLVVVGQESAFPWIERDIGIEFDQSNMPMVNQSTMQSTLPTVFFGGDAAFGRKNIITAVAHGHEAAVSIDRLCHGEDVNLRPPAIVTIESQNMAIPEWSFDNVVSIEHRRKLLLQDIKLALKSVKAEGGLGYDSKQALKEAARCLNCDIQPVFTLARCIECDVCVDICPMECVKITSNGDQADLLARLKVSSENQSQVLYVSGILGTGRVLARDEDSCLHCFLCVERCPNGALDMRKFQIRTVQAGPGCRDRKATLQRKAATIDR